MTFSKEGTSTLRGKTYNTTKVNSVYIRNTRRSETKNPLRHKALTAALAIMLFCPTNAISREATARSIVVVVFATAFCLKEEGLVSTEESYMLITNALLKQGISKEKILVLLQNKETNEHVWEHIKSEGGCVQIGKDYEKFMKGK